MLNRNVPGGPLILLAPVVVPIAWLFATRESTSEVVEPARNDALVAPAANGVVGSWYDDLGSKGFGDATMTIQVKDG